RLMKHFRHCGKSRNQHAPCRSIRNLIDAFVGWESLWLLKKFITRLSIIREEGPKHEWISLDRSGCSWKPYFRIGRRILVANNDKEVTTELVEAAADSVTEMQSGSIAITDNENVNSMDRSGFDYIWGSDQDDLIKEKGE